MKLRIVIAILIPILVLVGLGFIPDNGNAQYPPPSSPVPTAYYPPPTDVVAYPETANLFISYADCDEGYIEWDYMPFDENYINRMVIHLTTYNNAYDIQADWLTESGVSDWWWTSFDTSDLIGYVWDVEGIGYDDSNPDVPRYFTYNDYQIDCTILPQVYLPFITK